MTHITIILESMTQHKDSNADDKPQHDPPSSKGENEQDDPDWQEFLQAHSDDLGDVESSGAARKFERHARREQKKAALKASDLDQSAFVGSGTGAGRGPRDFSTSWLDVDSVMDQGSDFRPPQPHLGHLSGGLLLLWVLTLVGLVGLVAALFLPHLPGFLGPLCALATLIGIAGLISSRPDFRHSRNPGDDGARV
ncbi:hypothetical protein KIM372_10740 [Bombiscardovia nodaiensis]|uniref:Membrane associated protein n=1 Tax=Bombiscardovia nodaiensis TaxID=2932181 RepID=A0ABN6SD81_9BIFI|nr:hypothetical protein KIM372_10740 [Bombiscardovia nodaiensis]